jgi:hypothetical protein
MIPEIREASDGSITIETKLDKEIMNRKWAKKVRDTARKYEGYSVQMAVRDETYNLAEAIDVFGIYKSEANRGLIIVSPGEDAGTAALMMYYIFNPVGSDENENP